MAKSPGKHITLVVSDGARADIQNVIHRYQREHPKSRDFKRWGDILSVFRASVGGRVTASRKDWEALAGFLNDQGKSRLTRGITAKLADADTAERAGSLRQEIAERGEAWLDEPPRGPTVELEVDPQKKLFA